jgi:hypothetical protein
MKVFSRRFATIKVSRCFRFSLDQLNQSTPPFLFILPFHALGLPDFAGSRA